MLQFLHHTNTRHCQYDFPGQVISPTQRPLPDNTQHSQQKDIHATVGIRTRNPSKRAAAIPHLRQRRPPGPAQKTVTFLKVKQNSLKLPSKHNNSVQILVFYCGNMFRYYKTIFRPVFRDMIYNQCISCTVTWDSIPSHTLPQSKHAFVRLASHLHNTSTTFTWKNFNNHTRHPFVELRLIIRVPSNIV